MSALLHRRPRYGYDTWTNQWRRFRSAFKRAAKAKARRLAPLIVTLLLLAAYAIVSDQAPSLHLPLPCPSQLQPCDGPWTY